MYENNAWVIDPEVRKAIEAWWKRTTIAERRQAGVKYGAAMVRFDVLHVSELKAIQRVLENGGILPAKSDAA